MRVRVPLLVNLLNRSFLIIQRKTIYRATLSKHQHKLKRLLRHVGQYDSTYVQLYFHHMTIYYVITLKGLRVSEDFIDKLTCLKWWSKRAQPTWAWPDLGSKSLSLLQTQSQIHVTRSSLLKFYLIHLTGLLRPQKSVFGGRKYLTWLLGSGGISRTQGLRTLMRLA